MKKIKFDEEQEAVVRKEFEETMRKMQGIPTEIKISTHNATKVLTGDEKATVYFENEAYKRMLALVDNADKEIGWYGTVERGEKPRTFVVKKIMVFPQIVTGATVKTDDLKFIEWQDSLSDDDFNHCRFYGHSHVNMGVSPSNVDDTFYNDTLQNISDFYIFGIFNKAKSYWFNIYDIENNVLYENSDINYMYYCSDEDTWATEQIKANVTDGIVPVTSAKTYSSYGYGKDKDKDKDKNKDKSKWWEKDKDKDKGKIGNANDDYDSYWNEEWWQDHYGRKHNDYYEDYWD